MLSTGIVFLDDFVEDNDYNVGSPRSFKSCATLADSNSTSNGRGGGDISDHSSIVSSQKSPPKSLKITIPTNIPGDAKNVFASVSPRAPSPFRSPSASARNQSPARMTSKYNEGTSPTRHPPLHVSVPSSGLKTGDISPYPYLSPRPVSPFRSPNRFEASGFGVDDQLTKGRLALEKGIGGENKVRGSKTAQTLPMTEKTLTLHSKLINDLQSSSPYISIQRESSSAAMTDTSQSGGSSPQKM